MDKLSVKFSLKYIVLSIGVLLTALAALLYSWVNGWNVSFDQILKIIGVGIALNTLIYASMNLRAIYDANIENTSLIKKNTASKFIENWNSPAMTNIILESNQLVKSISEYNNTSDSIEEFQKDTNGRHACLSILNFIEHMYIVVEKDIADESVLCDFFSGIVIGYYSILCEVINHRRKTAKNQLIYKGVETLSKRWNK